MAAPTVSEEQPETDDSGAQALYLLLIGPGVTSTHPLPPTGSLLLGRADDADVRVVDPRASRNHARLHLGGAIEVEDLGSANGTRVRDLPLRPGERTVLSPGDAIAIGSTFLVVQRRAPSERPRRLWAHGYFEARLIGECGRAESARSTFALVRLHVDASGFSEQVEALVTAKLRPGDLLGSYGPNEYEMLLVDTERPHAEALVAQVVEALAREGLGARTGLAAFPEDGTSPGALFEHACALVRGTDDREPQGDRVIRNPVLRALYEKAGQLAAGEVSVLITGENGSGKELLARWIHERSPRAKGPFVAVNCGAFTESLLMSELFGHEKNAFNDAQEKQGILEAAAGGTVFLDEIGEMPANVQVALLRAIGNAEIRPVGSNRTRRIDVRFIAATNAEIEEEVGEGRFREDLFHRLGGDPLVVPPLRERGEEIEPLARHFVEQIAKQMRRSPPAISPEAVALLRGHTWTGNIRELRNVIERALLHCTGSVIGVEHLPAARLRGEARPGSRLRQEAQASAAEVPAAKDPAEWKAQQREIEKQAMLEALVRCAWNQTRAAELMGMPRRTFCKRMNEYGIRGPRAPR